MSAALTSVSGLAFDLAGGWFRWRAATHESASTAFTGKYCAGCHNATAKTAGWTSPRCPSTRPIPPTLPNGSRCTTVCKRGEMPPKVITKRPDPAEQQAFLATLAASLTAAEQKTTAAEGRATERRLNAYEYENALRDLLHAPWLELKGQFPEDGEAYRFNKSLAMRSTFRTSTWPAI